MSATLNERVAEEIRVLLARRQLTATQLAERAGMTQRSISRRITGEKAIDMDDLERIADALDVGVEVLLPGAGKRADSQANAPSNARWHGPTERATGTRPIGMPPKAHNAREPSLRRRADNSGGRPIRLSGRVPA